ncbi:hypothetical protein ALO46_200098 [Pseudomonas syringae pv. solidagae]|uniref:Uncharacterized protein n=1 Tax=Pseudomonas syringae pv. solidagae TaxID=264458 RepID=A0A0P9Z0V7_PSESX|nr:hypothetical protein ALO46_200098 [Pseudomonas syringae pv. solidagae]RMT38761.1 hypothetical protein ALP48_200102 [Pseudomonas syringae pv. solidagae]
MANTINRDAVPKWDVDSLLRPVVALSASMVSKDWEQASHHHRKAQLLYPCAAFSIVKLKMESGSFHRNALYGLRIARPSGHPFHRKRSMNPTFQVLT